ncbi:membrane-spanning 4-domains subfamily A member 12-like [Misgurnus anguillicaudatus]|uniref:membrane-spanning 4-domains subfamily A member 12-like n=1 Tax=Misgurnus anguillicaudatus TaxID=75329 RepID=UPI003CCFDFD4
MSTQVISTDNAKVVIQINPQLVQESGEGQDKSGTYHNAVLRGFFKAQPKALGTVQILIGVMIFLFGIVLTITSERSLVLSGVTYWGSLIYIIAGSLSVAAENKLNYCVVKASLGMNVVSAITAGAAIFLMSVNLAIALSFHCYRSAQSRDCIQVKGTTGIFLVFTILQFIISLCISAFACKATCDTNPSMVNVLLKERP